MINIWIHKGQVELDYSSGGEGGGEGRSRYNITTQGTHVRFGRHGVLLEGKVDGEILGIPLKGDTSLDSYKSVFTAQGVVHYVNMPVGKAVTAFLGPNEETL